MSYILKIKGFHRTNLGEVFAVVVLLNNDAEEKFSHKFNLTNMKARSQFTNELLKRFPDLKGKDIESQLLELLRTVPEDTAQDDDNQFHGGSDRTSQSQILVELVKSASHEFFHDGQVPFAAIESDGHREIWPVRSQNYKRLLGKICWESQGGKVATNDALSAALNVLEGFAIHDGQDYRLNNRVGWYQNSLYYDLTDPSWGAIMIDTDGWEHVARPPIVFRRFSHQLPQVMPVSGGDPKKILKYLRPRNEAETILWLAYIISCFIPDIAHPIPVIHGDPGSGKTTRMKIIRYTVDPSILPIMKAPRDEQNAVQLLSHHWMPFFDNMTSLPEWFSDALCRASTGEGASKRQLFTDDDDIIYSYQRCVGLNGINIVAEKSDLLDRSILMRYERIPGDDLQEESVVLAKFREDLPAILGGFMDILVAALSIKPFINLTWRSRLGDFVTWGSAISQALGYTQAQFLHAYSNNLKEQNQTALSSSLVASVLLEFMEDRMDWSGTPSELLNKLEPVANNLKINTRDRGWPKNPTWMAKRINEVKVNLQAEGIIIKGNRGNERGITIQKISGNTVVTDGDDKNRHNSGTTLNSKNSDSLATEEVLFSNVNDNTVTNTTPTKKVSDVLEVVPADTTDAKSTIISKSPQWVNEKLPPDKLRWGFCAWTGNERDCPSGGWRGKSCLGCKYERMA